MKGIKVVGIEMKIGRKIIDIENLENDLEMMEEMVKELKEDGKNIRNVDVGGGMGIK